MRIRLALVLTACTAAPALADDALPDDWAYRALTRPAVPTVRAGDRVRNPIDAFLLAKLEANGLTYSAEADRRALIRRATFDLTGLPPTPEEIDAFVADRSPDAYEKVVDRLLASPRFGERMAMYWLDLVRYAETDGFKADDHRPAAWRFRDYVIRSFNADKPYDRFVREQIAGDELYPGDVDALTATGYLRHYPDEYNAVNLEQRRQEILNDITDTTSAVFLGLTVGCARCHNHKYDPLSQEDYYRLQAFFAGYNPLDAPALGGKEREEYERQLAAWQKETAELRRELTAIEKPHFEKAAAKRKSRFPEEYLAMYEKPEAERSPLERQIAVMVARQVTPPPAEVSKSMKGAEKDRWQQMSERMAKLTSLKPPEPPTTMAMSEVGPVPPPTHLLKGGLWNKPGREVQPGFPASLEDRSPELPPANGKTTGRRAALAKWLTDPENPLPARVMVNRLWAHHFGKGLVGTPSDLGAMGEKPTHPELLDWLARAFVEKGWGLKAMHRLMVTSEAYRQRTEDRGQRTEVDPENKLLWRMNRRRLEGEALRDSILAVSGLLNLKAGGPSIYPELPAELKGAGRWPVSADAAERNRRSVYVYAKRNMRYPLFALFDAPDGNETCARRFATTSAPQALTLLNDPLILEHARSFAGRVLKGGAAEPDAVAERAFRLALGRSPDSEEMEAIRGFFDRQSELLRGKAKRVMPKPEATGVDPVFAAATVDFCHALLNVNEFLYVD